MITLPKCQTSPTCGDISYMVKSTKESSSRRDFCICSTCAYTIYSSEEIEKIPDLQAFQECIECAEFNLTQIESFKDGHQLAEIWNYKLQDFNKFKKSQEGLKSRFDKIVKSNSWHELPSLLLKSREFINDLFNSEIFKVFSRQYHCKQFLSKKLPPVTPVAPITPAQDTQIESTEVVISIPSQTEILEEVKGDTQASLNQTEETETIQCLGYDEFGDACKNSSISTIVKEYKSLSTICFDLDVNYKYELLCKIKYFKIPTITKLSLVDLNSSVCPRALKTFMVNSVSSNIKEMGFSFKDSDYSHSGHLNAISEGLHKIRNRVSFSKAQFGQEEFVKTLISTRNSRDVSFFSCKINCEEELDFGNQLSNVSWEMLNFHGTGNENHSNWAKEDFQTFKNIIKGLSKVESVKNRKITLKLGNCGITGEQVKEILAENEMMNMILD